MRLLLALLAAVLAVAALYHVRPAGATLDIETITVTDDLATGMTVIRTEDLNRLTHYYNLMLADRERLKQLTGCIRPRRRVTKARRSPGLFFCSDNQGITP